MKSRGHDSGVYGWAKSLRLMPCDYTRHQQDLFFRFSWHQTGKSGWCLLAGEPSPDVLGVRPDHRDLPGIRRSVLDGDDSIRGVRLSEEFEAIAQDLLRSHNWPHAFTAPPEAPQAAPPAAPARLVFVKPGRTPLNSNVCRG